MTLEEKLNAITNIEQVLHEYATYFIDWERLYNQSGYKPDLPLSLIVAEESLKKLAEELGIAPIK